MGEVKIEDKQIVVPGEEIASGMDFVPATGTYRDGESIIATRLGLLKVEGRVIKLIPVSGKYLPKKGDIVIGRIFDITMNGWRVEMNSAYPAMISLKDGTSDFVARGADLTRYYNIGDYVVAEIINVTSQNLVDLSMKGPGLRKLGPGRIVTVNTNKVPRIIGKQGSMVTMIKDATNTKITVGQNGVVWISGEGADELKAFNAVKKIEREAHIPGLTERIKEFLEQK